MNVNDFGHVSIVLEHDMMCARVLIFVTFAFEFAFVRISPSKFAFDECEF